MVRIVGNLADRRRTHKALTDGEMLRGETGDPKLREKYATQVWPQPAEPAPVQTTTTDAIAKLNEEQEIQNKQEKLTKQERQLKIDQEKIQAQVEKTEKELAKKEKELAGLDREKHPHRAKKLEKQINSHKEYLQKQQSKTAEISQKLSNVQAERAELPLEKQIATEVKPEAPKPTSEKASSAGEKVEVAPNGQQPVAETPKPATEAGKKSNVKPETSHVQIFPEEPVVTGEKAENQRIRSNPEAKAEYNRLKLKNDPELATRYESFTKTLEKSAKTKAWKKAGKIGIGIAAVAGLAYGAYKLFGGSDDKKPETTPEVKPTQQTQQEQKVAQADTTATTKPEEVEKSAEQPTQETAPKQESQNVVISQPVVPNDTVKTEKNEEAEEVKVAEKTENEEKNDSTATVANKPETEAGKAETAEEAEQAEEINEWIAKNGDNYWKYAKRELIFEHQGQTNYKPSNNEIAERMAKIMQRNGVKFANDGIHSAPMLKIGDKVKVTFAEAA